jgi:hypothetical protein
VTVLGRPGCCCCVPPEWVPVRGQYDATPVFGAIVSAHMADIDNGFTHETHNGTCPDLPDIVGGRYWTNHSTARCENEAQHFVAQPSDM